MQTPARTAQVWIGLGACLFLILFAALLLRYKRRFLDASAQRTTPERWPDVALRIH
jgi:hypothetical protein